jgi:Anti-sigma-K factor rskA
MRDDELDELLGAYALDALDEDEQILVDAYVARSPRALAEVDAHRQVASMMAVGDHAAPPELWDRIASSLGSQSAPFSNTTMMLPPLAPLPPRGEYLAPVVELRSRRRWIGPAALAAACVAGLAIVNVRQSQRIDQLQVAAQRSDLRTVTVDALTSSKTRKVMLSSDANAGRLEVAMDKSNGYVQAIDLPPLADGQVYQLWGVIDNEVISLGVLGAAPGLASFTADGPLTKLVLTVEQAGGVAVSEQPAFLAGDFA